MSKKLGTESVQSSCAIHLGFSLLSSLCEGEVPKERITWKKSGKSQTLFVSQNQSFLRLYCIVFFFQNIYVLCTVDLTVLIFPIFSNPLAFNVEYLLNSAKKVFCKFLLLLFQFFVGGFGCWEVNCWVGCYFQLFLSH